MQFLFKFRFNKDLNSKSVMQQIFMKNLEKKPKMDHMLKLLVYIINIQIIINIRLNFVNIFFSISYLIRLMFILFICEA
jgi:hypothetical protein